MGSKQGQAQIVSRKDQIKVLNSFIGTQHEIRNRAIFLMGFRVGLRCKELATVSVADFLFDPSIISTKTKYKNDDIKEVITLRSEVSKGGKISQAFIVDANLRKALVNYLNHRNESFNRGYDNLFISKKGTAFSPTSMSRLFLHMSRDSGVSFSGHSSRRTLATELMENNVHIGRMKKIMRHENISTTMLYIENDPKALSDIMRVLHSS